MFLKATIGLNGGKLQGFMYISVHQQFGKYITICLIQAFFIGKVPNGKHLLKKMPLPVFDFYRIHFIKIKWKTDVLKIMYVLISCHGT